MAKSFNLPSPEEYGKRLAEKRRRASGVPEILANLAKTTEGIEQALQAALADVAKQTAEQQKAANQENRQALGEAIEAVPLPFVLEKLETLMSAVESLADQIYRQGDAITRAMMPMQSTPVDVDLSVVEAKLAEIQRRVEQRNEVQIVEAPVPAQPSHMSLVVTDRDSAGDIVGVDVKVTRH